MPKKKETLPALDGRSDRIASFIVVAEFTDTESPSSVPESRGCTSLLSKVRPDRDRKLVFQRLSPASRQSDGIRCGCGEVKRFVY